MAVTRSSPDELANWQHIEAGAIAKLSADEVVQELKTQPSGLSSEEAAIRLQVAGFSSTPLRRRWRNLAAIIAVVVRPLLLPLWIGAFIAFSIDEMITAQALIVAAGLNTIVGALQERKAERATAALYDTLPGFARVIRDGHEQHIMSSMLAPGDILLLRPNDVIPADARLIQAENLHTVNVVLWSDESPMRKTDDAVFEEDSTVTELPNIVYAGGRVISGHGRAVVFATGLRSAFGHIAALTQQAHEEPSPLFLAIARLGAVVLAVGVVGAILGFVHATTELGLTIEQSLGITILFLTAAVPSGLLPGITITLLEGARRLQQHKAIFRRLSSVETLGATTVICADKTGTLTQNEMTVRELWTTDGALNISGVGYQPRGEFSAEQRTLDLETVQKQAGAILRTAVLTSTARLLPPDTLRPYWHILGDPVEAAQIVAAVKAGIKPAEVYDRLPQIAVFNSNRQSALDGVIVEEQNKPVAYIKGTPSDVLARCTMIATANGEQPLTERDRHTIKRELQRYQLDAMRAIAFARRSVSSADARASDIDQIAHDLVLLGLLAVVDPPRQEVAAAIETCHNASIRTIMLTSDDTLGATSLARRCTMVHGPRPTVISGPDLETMDAATLKDRLRSGDMVLARLTPEHKVRVVKALEDLGEVVLVTGGAASDVPALKAAYTGIAMGSTGSAAACQAADLILLDDNFATIAEAIAEGRAVEQRVRRLVALNLATTVVKLVALLASLFGGLPLLLTVGQQLVIDLLAGLLPGLAIGAGRPDPRLMLRKPRPTGRPLVSRKVYILGYSWFGGLASLLALVVTIVYLWQARNDNSSVGLADLFASNLQPYAERITNAAGQRGLIATSLYVVISVAALLGAALIPRSAIPKDRRPKVMLLGLIGLSFLILIAIVVLPFFHSYIALTTIPAWGWIAAVGVTAFVALLEYVRQRLDPIFMVQPSAEAGQSLHKIRSANER